MMNRDDKEQPIPLRVVVDTGVWIRAHKQGYLPEMLELMECELITWMGPRDRDFDAVRTELEQHLPEGVYVQLKHAIQWLELEGEEDTLLFSQVLQHFTADPETRYKKPGVASSPANSGEVACIVLARRTGCLALFAEKKAHKIARRFLKGTEQVFDLKRLMRKLRTEGHLLSPKLP